MPENDPSDSPPSYAASQQLCSICTQPLQFPTPATNPKPSSTAHIQRSCCGRWVCGACLDLNPRFKTYCPFCPTSTHLLPPSYDTTITTAPLSASQKPPTPEAEDTLHFLHPHDTVTSLSLQYNIPAPALRAHNRIFSDHLLSARHTVAIPGAMYQGPSLSPRPVRGEEEGLLKRFQIRTKCVDPEMAEVYLKESGWELAEAERKWWEDERWVREQTEGKGLRR